MAGKTGVFPVYENEFLVGAQKSGATFPSNLETFSVSFSNNIESWSPFDMKGWYNHMMTGKDLSITINGKRDVGDTGNDFLADKAFKSGQEANGYFCWTFPDGTKVEWDSAVYDVTNINGGDSTNVAALEVNVHPNGQPQVTKPSGTA